MAVVEESLASSKSHKCANLDCNDYRRAVGMKTAIEDRKKCNNAGVRKRLKTVSQRRGVR